MGPLAWPSLPLLMIGLKISQEGKTWGPFQKHTYELLNLNALNFVMSYKKRIFQSMDKIFHFMWNFKGSLWNSTQEILHIHWKICISLINGNLRALSPKCSYMFLKYRKVSNIRRTKCQHLNDSRLVLQLSVRNPLKPSVKSIMKM